MVAVVRRSLVFVIALGWMGLCGGSGFAWAQDGTPSVPTPTETKADEMERPLPDIPALMHTVEVNQRASEAIEKDYLYRSVQTQEETDGHGGVKKSETKEYDVFWVNGVPVHRLTKKNGTELSADEQKKESEKIDKEAAKAKERRTKGDEKGTETDPRGHEVVTGSRLLELGSFTNARRGEGKRGGKDVVGAGGGPQGKTRDTCEEVLCGTERDADRGGKTS